MDRVRQFLTFVKERIDDGELGGLFTDSEDSDDERDPIQVPSAIYNTASYLKQCVSEGEHGGIFTESEESESENEPKETDIIEDKESEPEKGPEETDIREDEEYEPEKEQEETDIREDEEYEPDKEQEETDIREDEEYEPEKEAEETDIREDKESDIAFKYIPKELLEINDIDSPDDKYKTEIKKYARDNNNGTEIDIIGITLHQNNDEKSKSVQTLSSLSSEKEINREHQRHDGCCRSDESYIDLSVCEDSSKHPFDGIHTSRNKTDEAYNADDELVIVNEDINKTNISNKVIKTTVNETKLKMDSMPTKACTLMSSNKKQNRRDTYPDFISQRQTVDSSRYIGVKPSSCSEKVNFENSHPSRHVRSTLPNDDTNDRKTEKVLFGNVTDVESDETKDTRTAFAKRESREKELYRNAGDIHEDAISTTGMKRQDWTIDISMAKGDNKSASTDDSSQQNSDIFSPIKMQIPTSKRNETLTVDKGDSVLEYSILYSRTQKDESDEKDSNRSFKEGDSSHNEQYSDSDNNDTDDESDEKDSDRSFSEGDSSHNEQYSDSDNNDTDDESDEKDSDRSFSEFDSSHNEQYSDSDNSDTHDEGDEKDSDSGSSEDYSSQDEQYFADKILRKCSYSHNDDVQDDLAEDNDHKKWYDPELDRRMKKLVDKSKTMQMSTTDIEQEFYSNFSDDIHDQDFELEDALQKGLDLNENVRPYCKRLNRTMSIESIIQNRKAEIGDSAFEGIVYIEDENNARVECKFTGENICVTGCSKTSHCFTGDTVLAKYVTEDRNYCEIIAVMKPSRFLNITHPVLLCNIRKFTHAMVPLCKSVPKIHVLNKRMRTMTRLIDNGLDVYKYDATTGNLKFDRVENLNLNNRKRKVLVVVIIGWNDDKTAPLGAVIDVINIEHVGTCLKLIKQLHKIPDYNNETVFTDFPTVSNFKDNVLKIFTIDSKNTKLKDDGFSLQEVEKDNNGILRRYKLGIHVTDVGNLIHKGTILDKLAGKNIATIKQGKFPTLDLLPRAVCVENCSLNPLKKRNALSLFFDTWETNDRTMKIENDPEIRKTTVLSIKEYDYENLDEILRSSEDRDSEDIKRISILQKVAKDLRRKRLNKNINKLSCSEVVEEFMIHANHCIANFIFEHEQGKSKICRRLLKGRRTSEMSEDSLSRDTYETVQTSLIRKGLGEVIEVSPWNDNRNSKEYECDVNNTSHAEYFAADRKSNQTLHSTLKRNPYTHFTSPMRRYVDIVTQRIVSSIIDNSSLPYTDEEIESICLCVNHRRLELTEYERKVSDLSFSNDLLVESEICLAEIFSFDTSSVIYLRVPPKTENGTDTVFEIPFSLLDLCSEPKHCRLDKHEDIPSCQIYWKKRIYCTYKAVKVKEHFPYFYRKGYSSKEFALVPYKNVALLSRCLASKVYSGCDLTNLSSHTKHKIIDQCKAKQTNDIPDIRSDEEEGLIFQHLAMVSFEIFLGQKLDVVLSSELQCGTLTPVPTLLSLTPNFQLCLQHTKDPIYHLTSYATLSSRVRYEHIKQYTHIWGKIIDMEATLNAVKEEDNPIICGVDITFKGRQGMFFLSEDFCVLRDIDIKGMGQSLSVRRMGIYCEELTSKSYICIRSNISEKYGDACYTWVGHAWIHNVKKTRKGEKIVYRICFTLHQNTLPVHNTMDAITVREANIELIMKSVVDRRTECCIQQLSDNNNSLAISIALGKPVGPLDNAHIKACNEVCEDFINNTILNNKQIEAVKKALRSSFSLIQGPPGTGKTYTGMELIRRLHQLNQKLAEPVRSQIIYCGPSNKSVDLVARWFLIQQEQNSDTNNKMRIVRMYGKSHETNDYKVPGKAEASGKKRQRDLECDAFLKERGVILHHNIRKPGKPHSNTIRDFERKFLGPPGNISVNDILQYEKLVSLATKMELKSYDVIFCTVTMAVAPNLLKATEGNIRQIVIDEAGMCTEPLSMAPIIANKPKQVVLIGDHKQLRPIVKSREATVYGLRMSLFERYANISPELLTLLDEQYRMNEHICEFPSNAFYKGNLRTRRKTETVEDLPKVWRNTSIPIVFFDVRGEEETLTIKTAKGNEKSKSNRKEIEKVKFVFEELLKKKISPKDINVMSQYNAQCKELKKVLSNTFLEDLNVNTVVSSQGGEWDYVIFSTVRSLPSFLIQNNPPPTWFGINLGFITDGHQINVALTRAKKGLILIGNMELLQTHSLWKKLLSHLKSKQCIRFSQHQF